MRAKISLITLLADDGPALAAWYRDALGFRPLADKLDVYTEFEHEGVRFAVCSRSELLRLTGAPSYQEARRGQAVELAFEVDSASEVDTTYAALVASGATPVSSPQDLPWGQRAAFFADPEGNIHEVFTNLPR